MEKRIFKIPKWAIAVYIIAALVLIPWTYNLAENLPSRQLAEHWDMAWVGLDGLMIFLLVLTIIFAIRRTIWVAMSATALATVLLIDVWFDVITAEAGPEQTRALMMAAFIGLPMAIVTYLLAHRAIAHLHNRIEHKR